MDEVGVMNAIGDRLWEGQADFFQLFAVRRRHDSPYTFLLVTNAFISGVCIPSFIAATVPFSRISWAKRLVAPTAALGKNRTQCRISSSMLGLLRINCVADVWKVSDEARSLLFRGKVRTERIETLRNAINFKGPETETYLD